MRLDLGGWTLTFVSGCFCVCFLFFCKVVFLKQMKNRGEKTVLILNPGPGSHVVKKTPVHAEIITLQLSLLLEFGFACIIEERHLSSIVTAAC